MVLSEPIAIKTNSFAKSICIWKEAPGKPNEQRVTGGLQTEVGRCLGLSDQPLQAVSPIRPSKPHDAEQQQSQPQGSMWTLSGQESRMWDAKYVSNLRGVSLNLGPACKSTFPIPESWEKLLSLRGALLPSSGALENGSAVPVHHLQCREQKSATEKGREMTGEHSSWDRNYWIRTGLCNQTLWFISFSDTCYPFSPYTLITKWLSFQCSNVPTKSCISNHPLK